MAVTQATELADFSSGIGTAGAILEVDNVNNKIGIGTTNPQALLQVGQIIKMDGATGIITATSFAGSFSGNATGLSGTPDITVNNIVAAAATFSGEVTYEDVTNIDSIGIITARSDISIADKIIHTGDTNTAIRFPSVDTFTVETAGTERLRVNSTGDVGLVGIATATGLVVVAGSGVYAGHAGVVTAVSFDGNLTGNVTGNTSGTAGGLTGSPNITCGTGSFTGDVDIADKIVHTGDTNTAIRFPAADTFTVETGGSEALRVNSDQKLLVGSTSSRDNFFDSSHSSNIQVEGNTTTKSSLAVIRNDNGSDGSRIFFAKSRGTGDTIVQDDDRIGSIEFQGNDGGGFVAAAHIAAFVDGTPGANDMPSRLVVSTTADGASSPTERLRIDSSGRLMLGTTTEGNAFADNFTLADSGNCGITIRSGTTSYGSIYFSDATSGGGENIGQIEYNHSNNALILYSNGSGRLTLTSDGKIRVPDNGKFTAGASDDLQLYHDGSNGFLDTITGGLTIRTLTDDDDIVLQTDDGSGGLTNYIQCDGSATSTILSFGGNARVTTTSDGTDFFGTGSIKVPVGTTGQRNASPIAGDFRYNSTTGAFEGYTSEWGSIGGSSGITTAAQSVTNDEVHLALSSAQDHKVTATGICTIFPGGGTEAESHTVRVINSGIATVGFSTQFLFPSGSAPSLPTADGAISLISFTINKVGVVGIATELLAGASVNFS